MIRPSTVNFFDKTVARQDRETWNNRKKRGGWRRVSLFTAIFSRENDAGAVRGRSTRGRAIAWANSLAVLFDSGDLFRAVTKAGDQNRLPTFTKTGIRIIINIPYAEKHFRGGRGTFTFGATESERLNTRIPPPPGRATVAARTDKDARLKTIVNERFHYKMRAIAQKRYPTSTRVPKRSWIVPISKASRVEISARIRNDFDRAIKRGR